MGKVKRHLKRFEAGEGYRYAYGGGWGNRIEWMLDREGKEVVGWKSRIPQIDDWLLCSMQSGKTGLHLFSSIERCGDPPDMFFATVELVGYVDVEPEEAATKSMFI